MILDILRLTTLTLALFFLGVNISIIRHHYHRPGLFLTIGRLGLTISIIIVSSLKLFSHRYYHNVGDFSVYLFYIVIIPALILYTLGALKYYRQQEIIEKCRQES